MPKLLLEIVSGEIPARMQEDAILRFQKSLLNNINNIFHQNLISQTWVTPQRIGVYIENLSLEVNIKSQEIRGPRIDAPEAAKLGFLKKNNSNETQLYIKDGYYHLPEASYDNDPINLLKNAIIETIKTFTWPKSMIDNTYELRWVRPMKSILCLLDENVLEFDYYHIKSSNVTFGHRFMAPEAIKISNFEDYKSKMLQAFVVLSFTKRKSMILEQISEMLANLKVKLINDENLLSEIVGLVEYPKIYVAKIPTAYMDLPPEVLITTLKNNQRYLMTQDNKGNLSPFYLIIANIEPKDKGETLIEGNNKVLSARLADAKYFYEQDLKFNLEDHLKQLKSLTFISEIGSVYQKQESVQDLAQKLAIEFGSDVSKVKRAVLLAKTDLVTNMVKEFPELQGLMGYYYGLAQGEDVEVASAIRDHYKPQGPSDNLPEGLVASTVALADKLDTLNQMFEKGIKPTSSKDPFALRRAAIGIIKILQHNNLTIDFKALNIRDDVQQFIKEREKFLNKV